MKGITVTKTVVTLRKGLRMDGTHITPGYVALIEAAMHSIDADIEYEED